VLLHAQTHAAVLLRVHASPVVSCSSFGPPAHQPSQHVAGYDEDDGLEVMTLDEPKIRPGMVRLPALRLTYIY
jgi:hypothetical protein